MTSILPQTMTAYRFKYLEPRPVAETVSVPTPSSDEVLVKILAGGVCHSDLTILDVKSVMHPAVNRNGFTMGHEGAGKYRLVIRERPC